MTKNSLKDYINGRHCEILGLGVSNLPLASKLLSMSLSVTARDKKDISELHPDASALISQGLSFISGNDCFDSFQNAENSIVFRSPGIRPDAFGIPDAVKDGSELTSEIELFLTLTEAETYGITGSDGKTTSTTLTGKFLDEQAKVSGRGRAFVGGNIGEPLLYRIDDITSDDSAVMELSSFQLMTVKKAPKYSAITNISPNHLDWHRGMDEYIEAKCNIIGSDTERFVTNAENEAALSIARSISQKPIRPDIYLFSSKRSSFFDIFSFGAREGDRAIYLKDGKIVISDGKGELPLLDTSKIKVPGIHNIENFMTAIALTYGAVDISVFSSVAESFFGVRHRLELVRSLDGIDYYNSSIDSSPTRTAAALSALEGRDIVIICGGYDKKIPYEPLAPLLCKNARAVVLTGATGKKIGAALHSCSEYSVGHPEYIYEPDFEKAVSAARALARVGGCVLLSPASASFDAFPNFAVRGDTFCEIVNKFVSLKN